MAAAATPWIPAPTLGDLVALQDGWKSGPTGVARQTDKGRVNQFLADWNKVEAFFRAKELPCHIFSTEECSPAGGRFLFCPLTTCLSRSDQLRYEPRTEHQA